MDKFEKFIAIILVMAVMFIIGLLAGEKRVIREQQIYSTENGYTVVYHGNEYIYN